MPTLVMHFNAFNGQLIGGYLAKGTERVSQIMGQKDVLAYLTKHPDTRCEPMKV